MNTQNPPRPRQTRLSTTQNPFPHSTHPGGDQPPSPWLLVKSVLVIGTEEIDLSLPCEQPSPPLHPIHAARALRCSCISGTFFKSSRMTKPALPAMLRTWFILWPRFYLLCDCSVQDIFFWRVCSVGIIFCSSFSSENPTIAVMIFLDILLTSCSLFLNLGISGRLLRRLAGIGVTTIFQPVPDVSSFVSMFGEVDCDEEVVGDIGLCRKLLLRVSHWL